MKANAASGNAKSTDTNAVTNGSMPPTPSDNRNSNATTTVSPYAGNDASRTIDDEVISLSTPASSSPSLNPSQPSVSTFSISTTPTLSQSFVPPVNTMSPSTATVPSQSQTVTPSVSTPSPSQSMNLVTTPVSSVCKAKLPITTLSVVHDDKPPSKEKLQSNNYWLDQALTRLREAPETVGANFASKTSNNAASYALCKKSC